jgi:hypothetical protein
MVDRTNRAAGIGVRHPVQTAAAVVGAVFLLVGVLALDMIGLGVLLGRDAVRRP